MYLFPVSTSFSLVFICSSLFIHSNYITAYLGICLSCIKYVSHQTFHYRFVHLSVGKNLALFSSKFNFHSDAEDAANAIPVWPRQTAVDVPSAKTTPNGDACVKSESASISCHRVLLRIPHLLRMGRPRITWNEGMTTTMRLSCEFLSHTVNHII